MRETDHLFRLRVENFPDISRRLPCTSHCFRLDHEPPRDPNPTNRKTSCAYAQILRPIAGQGGGATMTGDINQGRALELGHSAFPEKWFV